jgi:hypothetical protein
MTASTKTWITVSLVALAYSLFTVWGGAWLFVTMRGQAFPTTELLALSMQTVLALLPFALLVAIKLPRDERTRHAFLVAAFSGFVCSMLLWGYYHYDAITYDGKTGANIGLGIFMLFSPVIVYAVMHFAFGRSTVSK